MYLHGVAIPVLYIVAQTVTAVVVGPLVFKTPPYICLVIGLKLCKNCVAIYKNDKEGNYPFSVHWLLKANWVNHKRNNSFP